MKGRGVKVKTCKDLKRRTIMQDQDSNCVRTMARRTREHEAKKKKTSYKL